MKAILCATLLSLSSLPLLAAPQEPCAQGQCTYLQMIELKAAKEKLTLKKFPSDGIEQVMTIGKTVQNGIPETIQGIWWIGAKLPGDILCTFGNATWDEGSRTATVPVYGAGNFSFHANETGAASFYPLLATHFTYKLSFSQEDRYALITPVLDFLGHRLSVPQSIVKFAMRYVEDGHWVRESWLLGHRLPDYDFLRVVDAEGTRDPAYSDYLKAADQDSYLAVKL